MESANDSEAGGVARFPVGKRVLLMRRLAPRARDVAAAAIHLDLPPKMCWRTDARTSCHLSRPAPIDPSRPLADLGGIARISVAKAITACWLSRAGRHASFEAERALERARRFGVSDRAHPMARFAGAHLRADELVLAAHWACAAAEGAVDAADLAWRGEPRTPVVEHPASRAAEPFARGSSAPASTSNAASGP